MIPQIKITTTNVFEVNNEVGNKKKENVYNVFGLNLKLIWEVDRSEPFYEQINSEISKVTKQNKHNRHINMTLHVSFYI